MVLLDGNRQNEDMTASKPMRNKRGKYSKVGCGECKKMKIKCDEARPVCRRCLRLGKHCEYTRTQGSDGITGSREGHHIEKNRKIQDMNCYNSYAFSKRDLVTQGDSNARSTGTSNEGHLADNGGFEAWERNSPVLVDLGTYTEEEGSTSIRKPKSYNESTAFNGEDGLMDVNCKFSEGTFSFPDLPNLKSGENPDPDYNQEISQKDLYLLVSDLNCIINDVMPNDSVGKNLSGISGLPKDFRDETSSEYLDFASPDINISYDEIPRGLELDLLKPTSANERLYLEESCVFANFILPFNSFDGSTQKFYNPAGDILLFYASRASFLRAAILAQGAKLCFRKNRFQEDENAYHGYLSLCLRLLEPAVIKCDCKNKSALNSSVETTLLTILLLTSCEASDEKQERGWRMHLRSAKDLLLKFSCFVRQKKTDVSKVLIFCKFWFISVETLAGLNAKRGGTLQNDKELDLVLAPGSSTEVSVLKELGLLWDNGFLSFFGYHLSFLSCIKDLIKIFNRIRNKKANICNIFELLRLLSDLYKQSEFVFFIKDGICKESDFKGNDVPGGYLLTYTTMNEEKYIISWMDIAHLSYVFASILMVLRKDCDFKITLANIVS